MKIITSYIIFFISAVFIGIGIVGQFIDLPLYFLAESFRVVGIATSIASLIVLYLMYQTLKKDRWLMKSFKKLPNK